MERTLALEPSALVTSGSLPESLSSGRHDERLDQVTLPEEGIDLEEHLCSVRRMLMQQALARSNGQQKRAADLLRMSYRAFRYHAAKLGLTAEEEKE